MPIDPILTLNDKLASTYARWQPAQEAVDRIKWDIDAKLPKVSFGSLLAHSARERARAQAAWKLHQAQRNAALEAAGYVAARVSENKLWHAAARIERRMARTVPTTLLGVLVLARLAKSNHLHEDGRDRRMIARIIEALKARPATPHLDIVLALARKVCDEYGETDADIARGLRPLTAGALPAMILALETILAPRAVSPDGDSLATCGDDGQDKRAGSGGV